MSDFFSDFWSNYVAIATLVSIAAVRVAAVGDGPHDGRRRGADNTTGHVWDEDLREANNPDAALVDAACSSSPSSSAWPTWSPTRASAATRASSRGAPRGEYAKDLARANARAGTGVRRLCGHAGRARGRRPRGHGHRRAPVPEQLRAVPRLGRARQQGLSRTWPTATGCTAARRDKIKESITRGRTGVMPPMAAAVGTPEDVKNVANYVLSLSGSPHDSVRAGLGKSKFSACAACHGIGGERQPGAWARPTLPTRSGCTATGRRRSSRSSTPARPTSMPAQQGRLTEAQIHVLASYVWGLSNKPVVEPRRRAMEDASPRHRPGPRAG